MNLVCATPDYNWDVRVLLREQLAGYLYGRSNYSLTSHHPDRVLILGDTNSSLAAIVAARIANPRLSHGSWESLLRPRSPEEVNRRLIDHASSILLPYTERARQNLLAEGIRLQSNLRHRESDS